VVVVEDGADLLECDLLEQEETMVETPAVEPPTIGGATKRLNYFKKICPILLQIISEIFGTYRPCSLGGRAPQP